MRTALVVVVAACSSPAVKSSVPLPPAPAPAPVADPLNFDFEVVDGELPKGWLVGGPKDAAPSFTATIDHDAHHGATSLKIQSISDSGGFLPAAISTDGVPYRSKHVRLHGWVKTDSAVGAGAALWLRADGNDGRTHGFDNMGTSAVTGTTPWHEIVAETDLDAGADQLVLGVMLMGPGTAWFDSLSLEVTPIEPPKPLEVSGRVVDTAGSPVGGAEVLLLYFGVSQRTTSDASGGFRFDTVKGNWGITAHHAPGVGGQIDTLRVDKATTGIEIKLGQGDGTTLHIKAVGAPIPADTFAIVTSDLDALADTWRVPVATDGAITAVVPRAALYHVTIDGNKLVGSTTLIGGKPVIDARLDVRAPAPPPDVVTDYLRDHAVALTTTEAGNGFADMAAIGKMVGNAHVVGLGEATHGTREFFQLKHRFLEYLVAEKGFTVFAIEANQPESRAINDYIRDGKGDPKAALAGIYFWTWNTEEVLAMIEWMRTWNQDPKHVHKLEFTGFDMQFSHVAHHTVADFMAKVDPDHAEATLAPIKLLAERYSTEMIKKRTAAERKSIDDALIKLATQLDAHKTDYIKATSAEAYTNARHDVTIMQQWMRKVAGENTAMTPSSVIRDQSMADNVVWLRSQRPASMKMVVWAHNGHLWRDPLAMGSQLTRKLGPDYVVFGFAFGAGRFQAMASDGHDIDLRENTLGPAPEYDLTAPFTRAGKPLLVVDLRALPPGPIAKWFAEAHPMRSTGAVFTDDAAMSQPVHITSVFDALIFVANTTRARPVNE